MLHDKCKMCQPQEFHKWLSLSGRRKSTIKQLDNTFNFLLKNDVCICKSPGAVNYLNSLKERELSTSHINNFVNLCRLYHKFAQDEGFNVPDDLKVIKFSPDRFRVRSTMADDEIESFLNITPATSTHSAYNGTIATHEVNRKKHRYWTIFFSIMAYTGMRPGEVSKLKVGDVDFGRGVFTLSAENVKTNEFRYVPIPPNIEVELKAWVLEQKEGYLFKSSRPEGHTSNVEWQYNFQSRIKRLGIARPNLVPYSLRHSAATRWLEEDINLYKVQKILGHKDIRTTAIYTHMTTKDIIETIKKDRMVRKKLTPEDVLSGIEEMVDRTEVSKDPRFTFKKERKSGKLHIEVEINEDNQRD